MRVISVAAFLMLAGCDVDNDPANEKITVKYDREQLKRTAADAGRTAKAVATGAANVAKVTGTAIKREVGDIDVKVTRNRPHPDEPSDAQN